MNAAVARPLALLAAREPALRAGMRLALEPAVRCAEAETPAQAVELVERERPDVCFLEIDGGGAGMRAAEMMRQVQPETTVVLLTHAPSEEEFLEAVRVGAAGYLPEAIPPERLHAVVAGVLRGEAAVPRAFTRRVLDEFRSLGRRHVQVAPGRAVELTRRESEVLDFVRQGLPTHAIGRRLGVSDVTVRRHRSTLFAKLHVRSRQELLEVLDTDSGAAGAMSANGIH